jgi:hypothetical protein
MILGGVEVKNIGRFLATVGFISRCPIYDTTRHTLYVAFNNGPAAAGPNKCPTPMTRRPTPINRTHRNQLVALVRPTVPSLYRLFRHRLQGYSYHACRYLRRFCRSCCPMHALRGRSGKVCTLVLELVRLVNGVIVYCTLRAGSPCVA